MPTKMKPELMQHAAGAPAPIGPYSVAVRFGSLLFCSGQVAFDPETGALAGAGSVIKESELVFENIGAVLAAAGVAFSDVLKANVYLVDLADFAAVNEVFARAFGSHKPARTTIQVAALPRGARVEVEVIAGIG